MANRVCWILLLCSALAIGASTFDVYFIDVEGGKAMLAISPSGESLLVDAGWPGMSGRDADRIIAAARFAGLDSIDYLLITHYDLDHLGDVPLLLSRLPVRRILDNGELRSTGKGVEKRYEAYREARNKIAHTAVVRVGEELPVRGLNILAVTAGNRRMRAPTGKGMPNPACERSEVQPAIPEDLEDNMSIGLLYRYGNFRMLDLADVEWDAERDLMCPVNPIGTVDVYVTSVHGQSKAGSPALVHAVRPRVAIMNNGARKGGAPEIWDILRRSPGLQDIWQLHYSEAGGRDHNAPPEFIANVQEPCEARWLRISANADGSFTVTNSRNGFSRTYR